MSRFLSRTVTLALTALVSAWAAYGADAPKSITSYRWVDAQGVVHFSDTPQPGAQAVQIQPAQTYRAGSAAAPAAAGDSGASGSEVYRQCTLGQPQAEQSFYAPETVEVAVQLDPQLRSGDHVAVMLDGHALQSTDPTGLRYRIESPDRGAHTLAVSVRDATGTLVCSSAAVTFYVQRPSLLSPQSPQSPTHEH